MELPRKPIVPAAMRSETRPIVAGAACFNVVVFRGGEACSFSSHERRIDAECAFTEAVVRAEGSTNEHGEPCRVELILGEVLLDVAHIDAPARQ